MTTVQNKWDETPMMRAVRSLPTDRVPVWMMRQAGRYMAEYRDVRSKMSFLQLCKNPELAAEVMTTAVKRLGVDAAIIFSDILLPLEPMGLKLDFLPEGGPVFANPITKPDDVFRVRKLESIEPLEYIIDVVKTTRTMLDETPSCSVLPLIGFAGAPFTLASYAIEGKGSRDFRLVKSFMHQFPVEWDVLMRALADSVALLLNAQIDAGVQIVQLFDSWAGCLAVEDYRQFVLPYSKIVLDSIRPETPIIHFAPGNPALLPSVREAGGDVIGVDWRIPLDSAWQQIGYDRAVQGNMDPTLLLTTPEIIRKKVGELIYSVSGRPGFICNLGHGILQQTPVENAIAFVDAVHDLTKSI
ncbi:MAG: uroporphyrinogen decarboxylase [Thermoguttaceae bacterium]